MLFFVTGGKYNNFPVGVIYYPDFIFISSHIRVMNEEEIHLNICKLGDKLLSLRKSKGLSQQELSFRSGIEKPYIRKIEKGRTNPTVKTLLKLSFALETPIQLFFEDNL